jgi:hypothetical protein
MRSSATPKKSDQVGAITLPLVHPIMFPYLLDSRPIADALETSGLTQLPAVLFRIFVVSTAQLVSSVFVRVTRR